MTLPVVVGVVKSSHKVVDDITKLKLIWPDIFEKANEMETVMPSIHRSNSKYAYVDKATALIALTRLYEDTIEGTITIKGFFRYLRRLFIVSGLVENDKDLNQNILEIYQFARYKEANKDEIY